MARDLTARSQKDTPDNYEYRTATDLSQPQLNWTNATDKITETIGQIQGDRQRRRDETNQYTTESLDALSKATEFDNVNYNQNVMEMGYQGSDLLYGYYNQIGKNGYTQRQYKADVQNVLDGMSAVSDVYTNLETYYTDITARTEGVDGAQNNIFEQYLGNSLLGYTNAGNFRPMFDPNGNVVMVENKYDENGKLLPPSLEDRDATQSVNTMLVKMGQRSDYVNVYENASPLIDKLGKMIEVELGPGQSSMTIEDWTRKEYKDPITGETITNEVFLDNLVAELTESPDAKISILQTYYGYGEDNFTEDPNVAANDKSKVLIERNPNRSGMSVMVFNEEQEEQIKQLGKEILLSGIDYEEKFAKGFSPSKPTESSSNRRNDKQNAQFFLGYLVDFVEGNSDLSDRAKRNIAGEYNQGKRVGDNYLTTLNRVQSENGGFTYEIGFDNRTPTVLSNVDSQGNIIPETEIIEQLYNNLKLSGNNTTFGAASTGVDMTGGYGVGSALGSLPQVIQETETVTIPAPDYFSNVIYQIDQENFFEGSPVEYLRQAQQQKGVFEDVALKTAQDNLLEQLMPQELKDRIGGSFAVVNLPGFTVVQIGNSQVSSGRSPEEQFVAFQDAINAEIKRLNAGASEGTESKSMDEF